MTFHFWKLPQALHSYNYFFIIMFEGSPFLHSENKCPKSQHRLPLTSRRARKILWCTRRGIRNRFVSPKITKATHIPFVPPLPSFPGENFVALSRDSEIFSFSYLLSAAQRKLDKNNQGKYSNTSALVGAVVIQIS